MCTVRAGGLQNKYKFTQGPLGVGTKEWNKWGDICFHCCTNYRWYVKSHMKKETNMGQSR